MRVGDLPGQRNWYRVVDETITIPVDNTRDPDKMNPDYLANRYNMFTDELFEDGTVTLTLDASVSDYFKIQDGVGVADGIVSTYRSISNTCFPGRYGMKWPPDFPVYRMVRSYSASRKRRWIR